MSETMLQNPPALGRLIGVSLGPGDPGLITRAAWAQLQRTDAVWTYPARSTKTPSYAFDIVQRAGLAPPAQHQTLLFPMTHDGDKLARAFGVSNHTLVHGKAPEGLDAWPDPDAVFIGGSGGELQELIALCLRRLRTGGWLVMNFVTLENLASATQALQAQGAVWDVLQLQAARSKPILHMHRMAAENPVWIVCAQRGDGGAVPAEQGGGA